ncbi:hypothetical protein ACFV42_13355 [Streptomyces solisilvae]|uniref:hypothetical protein n=1 Tax=Streptomyces malaysiensis TaxID=92644 RepID=UPI003699F336
MDAEGGDAVITVVEWRLCAAVAEEVEYRLGAFYLPARNSLSIGRPSGASIAALGYHFADLSTGT